MSVRCAECFTTERVVQVAEAYIEHRLLPRDAAPDAFHLALASVHRADFLLTWNCKHLANANKVRHIAVLNRRMNLHVPVITTPYTLLPESDHEAQEEGE